MFVKPMLAAAESGKGSSGLIWPAVTITLVGAVTYYSWQKMESFVQTTVLQVGWPVLSIIATTLTLAMLKRVVRNHRGFMV